MEKIFVIADLNLFDDKQREKLNFSSFEQMNQHIVKNWNSVVKDGDSIIVMGIVGKGSKEELKSVLAQLNGNLVMISRERNSNLTREEWEEIGIFYAWNTPLYKKLDNNEVIFYCNEPLKDSIDIIEGYKIVVVDSTNPINEVVIDNKFSAAAILWDYSPIDTDYLEELYINMKLFSEMENEEHITEVAQ